MKSQCCKTIYRSLLITLSLTTISQSIFADTTQNNFLSPHGIAYITGGVTMSTLSNTNDVVMDQFGTTNTYNADQGLKAGGLAGVSLQVAFHNHDFNTTLGPAFYYASLNSVSGTEYPDSSGGTNPTLNYQFNAQSFALMVESHVIYTAYSWQPTAMLGFGNAWNALYNYSEAPTDSSSGAAVPANFFSNYTQNSFAYEVGFGVQHEIATKRNVVYIAAVDYRYFNFGSGKLGQSGTQNENGVTNSSLGVNTLYAQTILFSLGAIFNW